MLSSQKAHWVWSSGIRKSALEKYIYECIEMAFETTRLGKVNNGVNADRKDAKLNTWDLKHCKI